MYTPNNTDKKGFPEIINLMKNEYEIIPTYISLENLRKNGNPDLISKSLSNYIETGHMPVSNFS